MRLRCNECGAVVSNEVPKSTVVRAWLVCADCVEKRPDKEDKWQAVITKVNNGFTIAFKDSERGEVNVYQEKESAADPDENREHVVDMLWDLLEFFGEGGSKHDKKRIKITYESQNG